MSGTPQESPALIHRQGIARQVAAHLESLSETVAIVVFGSVAHGMVDDDSDVDVLVVCRPTLPSRHARHACLVQLGTGWTVDMQPDANALFADEDRDGRVDDVLVTIHYQTEAWIDAVLNEVLSTGAITTARLPFRPYTLPALLQRAWVLSDPDGIIERWRTQAAVYPAALQRSILAHAVPRLREHVAELQATARRGLSARMFLFLLNWAVDELTTILFALNRVYDPADKRMDVLVVPYLPWLPDQFMVQLTDIVEGPFDPAGMRWRAERFGVLAAEALAKAAAVVGTRTAARGQVAAEHRPVNVVGTRTVSVCVQPSWHDAASARDAHAVVPA